MVDVKTIIIAVVVIILVILIIRWIMGDSTKIDGLKDAKKVTKIQASDLEQSTASNFAYSTWFYIDDWSYRYGEPKIVLGRLDSDLNPSPSIVLGAIENNLQIETTVYPSAQSTSSSKHTCNVANVPIQKWVNVIVSLYGRTLDVYIDGKLVRTCVLPGVAKIANNAPVYVTPLGGFSGYTSNIHYYSDALNPQQAYNIYREGYGGGFGADFPYSVKVEFLKDGTQQGSIEI
ncbi:LamG domain-containing protein [Flavobacteriaceae bacterium]|nr:LamG domain-containing protein [Flavobacteriaceae bacterium]